MSLTVRTPALSRAVKISLSLPSSDELMYKTRQTHCVLRFHDPLSRDGFAIYGFTCDDDIESRAEWILAEHTNGKRVCPWPPRQWPPFHESGEVVEVGRPSPQILLVLIFGRKGSMCQTIRPLQPKP